MKRYIAIAFCVLLLLPHNVRAAARDGQYEAVVRTEGGTYNTPVSIRDGEVIVIHFESAGDIEVTGGGMLRNGQTVAGLEDSSFAKIQITDPSYIESAVQDDDGY